MTLVSIITPLGLAAIVAKGTLLLALGWCGTAILKRSSADMRHLVWLTVLAGVLLVPVLAQVAPMNVPLLPSISPNTFAAPVRDSIGAQGLVQSVVAVSGPSGAPVPSSVRPRLAMPSIAAVAVVVWLGVAAGLALWLLAGMLWVRRIIRRSDLVDSPEWIRALREAAESLNLASSPRLVMSDQVEMAFAFDAFAPTIILPVSAEEWSDDRRRAVLLHELAHIRRRDLIGHIVASAACAVYWFNPLVWAAARRLRVESELASDDVVLESGVRPTDYAQHLLDLVTGVGRGAPAVALAMARPKEFEGRLVAILDRAKRRRALGRAQVGAMVGLLGLMTVSIAAVVPVRRTSSVVLAAAATATEQHPSAIPDTGVTPPRNPVSEPRTNLATGRRRPTAPLSDAAVAALLRYGTSAVINPMIMILREADGLNLTGKQADSIATLNRAYMIRLNAIWSPVSSYYLSHPPANNESSLHGVIRRAPRASMDELIRLVPNIMGLLTADQRRLLSPRVAGYLDVKSLAGIAGGERSDSGGVFLSDGGFLGGPRGGGRRGR